MRLATYLVEWRTGVRQFSSTARLAAVRQGATGRGANFTTVSASALGERAVAPEEGAPGTLSVTPRKAERETWWLYKKIARWMIGNPSNLNESFIAQFMGVNTHYAKRQRAALYNWYAIVSICEGERILNMIRIPEEERNEFIVWWELISVHTWLLVRRSRAGTRLDRQITENVVEEFWKQSELKLFEEEGMPFMKLAKWNKQLQRLWYARSLLMDAAVEKKDFRELDQVMLRNMTCLKEKQERATRLREYIISEMNRIQNVSEEDVLEGKLWDTNPFATKTKAFGEKVDAKPLMN